MKVLLRYYNKTNYVWKKAKWGGGYYRLLDNNDTINEVSILAVEEDERIGYVQCAYCGELIKNDPESIEAHYAKTEAKKNCMECESMVLHGNKMDLSRTLKKNANGTFYVEETYNTKALCNAGYYKEDIYSDNAKKNCKFAQCRRRGVRVINDTFIKYPGLFEKQITIDMLTAKKYEFDSYNNGYYEYDLKMRGTLKACVNGAGVVDHFVVSVRGWRYNFYYSDKYNKLFYHDWNRYNESMQDIVNAEKEAKILEKISKLYEGAKVNE